MNALSLHVRQLLAAEFTAMAADETVRCVVITGDEKAFAAGADVGELGKRKVIDDDFAKSRVAWTVLEAFGKPIIAAINGFALGGGCELAMHCDILIAGENA